MVENIRRELSEKSVNYLSYKNLLTYNIQAWRYCTTTVVRRRGWCWCGRCFFPWSVRFPPPPHFCLWNRVDETKRLYILQTTKGMFCWSCLRRTTAWQDAPLLRAWPSWAWKSATATPCTSCRWARGCLCLLGGLTRGVFLRGLFFSPWTLVACFLASGLVASVTCYILLF